MKLSDIKGERTLEVVADIIGPITNIAMDDEASAFFKKTKLPKGKTSKEFLLERISKSLPVLLKAHKTDVISILATIEGVTPTEYGENLNLAKLFQDFVELFTDEAFGEFFT